MINGPKPNGTARPGFIGGVGRANLDLIYSGMPRMPGEGEELYASGFAVRLGGGPCGTLTNLSRLKIPTRLVTYLGKDMFSRFAAEEFEKNGMEPVNLYHGEGIPLNISTAVLTPGERTFISYTDGIRMTEQMREDIYHVLHGAALLPIYGGEYELMDGVQQLHQEGTVLVLDMGWDDEMSLDKYRGLIEIADYFTPNTSEALKLTGEGTPERAALRLRDYFERVIVKLDRDGCLIVEEDGRPRIIPSIDIFQHVDSTGAGDAFLAGFLYGLYHGHSFRESVLYGNLTGGKCVTALGCLEAYLTEEELLTLGEKYRSYLEDQA